MAGRLPRDRPRRTQARPDRRLFSTRTSMTPNLHRPRRSSLPRIQETACSAHSSAPSMKRFIRDPPPESCGIFIAQESRQRAAFLHSQGENRSATASKRHFRPTLNLFIIRQARQFVSCQKTGSDKSYSMVTISAAHPVSRTALDDGSMSPAGRGLIAANSDHPGRWYGPPYPHSLMPPGRMPTLDRQLLQIDDGRLFTRCRSGCPRKSARKSWWTNSARLYGFEEERA